MFQVFGLMFLAAIVITMSIMLWPLATGDVISCSSMDDTLTWEILWTELGK